MSRNPLRYTVKHFMEAGTMRFLKKERREQHARRHSKKSNFVRFLESLENRGPMTIHNDLYSKWTKEVRRQMEEAGTWPKPNQETNLKILAEYLCRLQAVWWLEFPDDKWYEVDWFQEVYNPDSKFRPYRKILRKIVTKVRNKGMRDRTYKLTIWGSHWPSMARIKTYIDVRGCEEYPIRPFTPFNNQGDGI